MSRLSDAGGSAACRFIDAAQVQPLYDVAVVGAGPSGALLATQAAAAGLAVLLVEKHDLPRYKVCGCCLSVRSLQALDSCGLGAVTSGAPEIGHLTAATESRRLHLPLPRFRALSRSKFDMALVTAAMRRGAQCLPATSGRVVASSPDDQTLALELVSNSGIAHVRSRVVVVADGLSGTTLSAYPQLAATITSASRMGIGSISQQSGAYYAAGTIYMACGDSGYVGLVRLEDESVDIAAAFDRDHLRAFSSPAEAVARLLEQCAFPVPADLLTLSFKGTAALTRSRSQVAAHRLFIIGDAASYVEPFTGEGIAWALESALCLAPLAVAAARQWDDSYRWRWQHIYRRQIKSRQRATKLVAALLRQPRLVETASDIINAIPGLPQTVSKFISGGQAKPESLCLPF